MGRRPESALLAMVERINCRNPGAVRVSAEVLESTPEEVPGHVDAMTTDELFRAQGELDLYPDAVFTFQASVLGLPLPDCVARASRFLEECALMM